MPNSDYKRLNRKFIKIVSISRQLDYETNAKTCDIYHFGEEKKYAKNQRKAYVKNDTTPIWPAVHRVVNDDLTISAPQVPPPYSDQITSNISTVYLQQPDHLPQNSLKKSNTQSIHTHKKKKINVKQTHQARVQSQQCYLHHQKQEEHELHES